MTIAVRPKRNFALERAAFESNRHREERSDAAIQGRRRPTTPGLLRLARNDDRGSTQTQFARARCVRIVIARSEANAAIQGRKAPDDAWIASLGSQ
jgi:hypothetical protein